MKARGRATQNARNYRHRALSQRRWNGVLQQEFRDNGGSLPIAVSDAKTESRELAPPVDADRERPAVEILSNPVALQKNREQWAGKPATWSANDCKAAAVASLMIGS